MQAQLAAVAKSAPNVFARATRLPPPNFSSVAHRMRCLSQLRSKTSGLEKYIFLNGLKERDPALFYSLLYENMKVCHTSIVRSPAMTHSVTSRS